MPPSPPTAASRKYRPSRRNWILDAALEEISANGYVDTTLAAIASRAGISIPAFYYHFSGKMAVFTELVEGIGRSICDELAGINAASLRDLLEESCRRFETWCDGHPREAELYFDRAAGVSREVEQLQRAWTNRVASDVRDRAIGFYTGLDPLLAGLIGLTVPVVLGEYASVRRSIPARRWRAVRGELLDALSQMADRIQLLAERAADDSSDDRNGPPRGTPGKALSVVPNPDRGALDLPALRTGSSGSGPASPGIDFNGDRRDRVVEAAISVFADKGIDEASVIEIATRAGIPRATVYDDFGSKEGLLAASVADVADEISAVERDARQREPYPECIVERVAAVFRWVEAHQAEARLLYLRARAAGPEAVQVIEDLVQGHIGSASGGPAGALLVRRVAVQTDVATVTAWLSREYFPPEIPLADLIVPQARLHSWIDGRPDPPPPLGLEQHTRALGAEARVALVLRIIQGESPFTLAQQSSLDPTILRTWAHLFVEAGRQALIADQHPEPEQLSSSPRRRPRKPTVS